VLYEFTTSITTTKLLTAEFEILLLKYENMIIVSPSDHWPLPYIIDSHAGRYWSNDSWSSIWFLLTVVQESTAVFLPSIPLHFTTYWMF